MMVVYIIRLMVVIHGQMLSKNIKGLPTGSWIPQIKASNKNKGEALLIANDYRRFNYTPYAYRTRDYGKTWDAYCRWE